MVKQNITNERMMHGASLRLAFLSPHSIIALKKLWLFDEWDSYDRRKTLRHITAGTSLTRSCVLDVGCGTAQYAQAIAGSALLVAGLDIHPPKLELNRPKNLELVRADARKIPFASKSFDLVFEKDVLHHLPRSEIPTVLAEMRRVAKYRATIKVIEANRWSIWPLIMMTSYPQEGHEHLSFGEFHRIPRALFSGYELLPAATFEVKFHPLTLWTFLVLVLRLACKRVRPLFHVLKFVVQMKECCLKRWLSYNVATIKNSVTDEEAYKERKHSKDARIEMEYHSNPTFATLRYYESF